MSKLPAVFPPGARRVDRTYSTEFAAKLARQYTEEAIGRLVDHMRQDDPRLAGVSLAATNALLDRAYGKPKEIKEIGGINGGSTIAVDVAFVDVVENKPSRPAPDMNTPVAPEPVELDDEDDGDVFEVPVPGRAQF
jgi:hypothetical protein